MRVRSDKSTPRDPDAVDQVMNKTRSAYRSFSDYVAFRDDDPTWMLAYKLMLRFMGIVFMIILSPFLIVGLTLAFIAVF